MDARKLARLRTDLASFLDDVAGNLGHPRRRRWCDAYLRGILLDDQRKSVEPMAACWLLAEWPKGAAPPTKYFFSNLPASTSSRSWSSPPRAAGGWSTAIAN